MRLIALILSVLLAVTACTGESGQGVVEAEVFDVTPGEAEMLIETDRDLLVLDVRTEEEYDAGHLPRAVNVDYYAEDFAAQLDRLPKDRPVLVYCRSGNRSGKALPVMDKLGFTEIRHMEGGWNAWAAEGLPVE